MVGLCSVDGDVEHGGMILSGENKLEVQIK